MRKDFTAAPWGISKLASPEHSPKYGIYADGSTAGNYIAIVQGENAAANAVLVAAAPEMYAALILMLNQFQDHERYDEDGYDSAAIKAAREAISNASLIQL